MKEPGDQQLTTGPQCPPAARGRLLIVIAALLWGTSGFFAKAPLLDFWAPSQRGIQLAFWRVLFASVLLFPMVRRVKWTWRLVPAAVSFSLMNICFLMAMTTTTEANAIWLQYTAPALVLLVGVAFLGERAARADWWMMGLCFFGVLLIIVFEYRAAAQRGYSPQGIFWGLASGVTFAAVILSIRALRDLDSAWLTGVCHICAAATLTPIIVVQEAWPTGSVLVWVAAFGMLQLGLPYFLFATGARTVSAHEAAFIGLLEPIFVPFWAYAFWRNTTGYAPPATWTLAGAAFILAGLILRFGPRTKRA